MSAILATGIALAAVLTATLSGIFGMAGGIVLMGIFLALLPVSAAMMLHGTTQAVSNGYRAFLTRDHINWSIFLRYMGGAALSLAVLSSIAFIPDKAVVFLAVGAIPFIAALLPKNLSLDITRPGMPYVCGFAITLINLVAGVAGPLLDTFFVRTELTRHQVVATKAVTQTLSHLMKLVYFGLLVSATSSEMSNGLALLPWWIYLLVMPCAMLGTTLGTRVLDRMSDVNFRRWSQWIVLALGTVCILRGIYLISA